MIEPVSQGRELLLEMQSEPALTPALWWLGHSGFALKFRGIVFYIDPCLGDVRGRERIVRAPLRPEQVVNADLVLCTHGHRGHMDPATLPGVLAASPRCRVVLPRGAAGLAFSAGVPYERMTSTDADLRVEYVSEGTRAVVYSIPSAHPDLEGSAENGYPYLGYVVRFDGFTIYHAGDCRPYDGLVEKLRPYRASVALLPIGGPGNMGPAEAAQLAEDIGARWVAPMHYGAFAGDEADAGRFIDHMLGQRPALPFKVFAVGEKWTVPVEAAVL
jgi:L-ascorbate 6-phosphate lactonase